MPRTPRQYLAPCVFLAACAACIAPRSSLRAIAIEPAEEASRPAEGVAPLDAVLAAARQTAGRSDPELDGRPVPADCSGYLRALFAHAGLDLLSEGQPGDNGVRAIVRFVERRGRLHRHVLPAPGDLVFFDNSYDRNGDRRLNDRLTHAGLVESVLPDGTALVVHATNHGIVREPMNLLHPHDVSDGEGRAINAFLRRKSAGDSPRTPRLMSELFAGFGRVFERETTAARTQEHGPQGRSRPRTR